MSKILYVCYRDYQKKIKSLEEKIKNICDDLNPDNISANPTITYQKDNIIYGISNPVNSVKINNKNILLGKLFEENQIWDQIFTNVPDGNYAIFRANENNLEIITDLLGTRTVWYYKDEEKFMASTSQRAIIKYLQSFEFDERIIPWFISSGSLGPSFTWDKRLKRLQPGSLLLDIRTWQINFSKNKVIFSVKNSTDAEFEKALRNSLHETFAQLDFDYSKWALSLSGGHDCRGILAMLNKRKKSIKKIKTVTWGISGAEKKKKNDAYVAQIVAEKFDTNHLFFQTNSSKESANLILMRFLKNGEGRIDHFSGYTDGFQIWKSLFENNIEGVIRGNQVFGQKSPNSSLAVRNFIGISLCLDYKNLERFDYIKSLKQELPADLQKKSNESLATWRDRLIQEYRLPVIQAALTDLKLPYVEQFDPLLSREIIEQVRSLPDHLRNNKSLFQEIVKSLNPGIEYASKNATQDQKNIFTQKEFVELFKQELSTENAKSIFPNGFLEEITRNLKDDSKAHIFTLASIKKVISKNLPNKLKKTIYRKIGTQSLDYNILAFRLTIISKMVRLFKEDSESDLS